MPRSWSIASKNKVTEPARPSGSNDATRFRSSDRAIDLKKLLEVYDDYPVVLNSLERTHDALDRAEEDARVAEERKEQADEELRVEKEERERERKKAEKDQKEAIKRTDDKVRAELNPKIKDLEEKLKAMTLDRDTQKKDLGELRGKMHGWISGMDRLHKERIAGEEREVKAAEERKKLADKLKALDDEILEGLRNATDKPTTTTTGLKASSTHKGSDRPAISRVTSTATTNTTRDRAPEKKAGRFAEHDW
jgi:chromosome segregation ATPase